MVSYWARTDRVARTLTEGERERRDEARAGWADLLQQRIAIAPTLAREKVDARRVRAKAIAYADLRKERQRQASRHVANQAHRPHHHLRGGGTV
jgi:hypothetical protein